MPAGLRARPPLPMPLLLRPLPSGLAGIISTRARTGALQGRAGLPQAAPVETQALELRSRVHLSGYRSGGALTTDIHVPRRAMSSAPPPFPIPSPPASRRDSEHTKRCVGQMTFVGSLYCAHRNEGRALMQFRRPSH